MHLRLCLLMLFVIPIGHVNAYELAYALWQEPTTHSETLAYVKNLDEKQWSKVSTLKNYGFNDKAYWIRLDLNNNTNISISKIIKFVHPAHDYVDIYHFSSLGALQEQWHLGDMVENIKRPVLDKNVAFDIQLAAQDSARIYIRITGINAMWLALEVLDPDEHASTVQISTLISGIAFGILLAMIFYNLGLAISIKDRTYFVYVACVTSFVFLTLFLNGEGLYYLWPNSHDFNNSGISIASTSLILFSLLFPYYLLNFKKNVPRIAGYVKWAVALLLLYLCLIPFLAPSDSIKIINTVSIFWSFSVFFIGIYLTIKRVPIAAIYTLAWFLLLLGTIVLPLSSLGLIESNIYTRNANLIGGVFESLILSLALAQRIRLERKGRLRAIESALQSKAEAVRNRKMFEELFNQAPVGIFRLNVQGAIDAVNPVFATLLGYKNVSDVIELGTDIRLHFPQGRSLAKEVLSKGSILDKEVEVKKLNGNLLICSITMRVQQRNSREIIEGFITDISERKKAEHLSELMEHERMMSMEQLVTGVAHEINTPLGNNITSLSHIMEILKEVDDQMQSGGLTKKYFTNFVEDSHKLMAIMSDNLQSISNVVKRFKLVSIKQVKSKIVNVNVLELFKDVIDSKYFIVKNIEIIFKIDTSLRINSYPAAWQIILEQLLENTMLHGFKEDRENKKIIISITQENDNFIFMYQDNGCGLKSEVAKKVFDPFVTTRRGSSENAGLGLYRVYNIVRQVLKAEVEVMEGAGFNLRITFK